MQPTNLYPYSTINIVLHDNLHCLAGQHKNTIHIQWHVIHHPEGKGMPHLFHDTGRFHPFSSLKIHNLSNMSIISCLFKQLIQCQVFLHRELLAVSAHIALFNTFSPLSFTKIHGPHDEVPPKVFQIRVNVVLQWCVLYFVAMQLLFVMWLAIWQNKYCAFTIHTVCTEDTIVYNVVNNPDVCIENSTSYVFSIIFNANPPQPVAVYVYVGAQVKRCC